MAIDVDFLGHAERVVLLRRAAAESGYREDTTSDMLRAVLLDERGPGICTAPDCRCGWRCNGRRPPTRWRLR